DGRAGNGRGQELWCIAGNGLKPDQSERVLSRTFAFLRVLIGQVSDRCQLYCGESLLQLAECLADFVVKDERLVFLEESCERLGNTGETLDEATVEVGKAEECLDLGYGRWLGPIDDGGNLLGIHLDTGGGHEVAEVFNFT